MKVGVDEAGRGALAGPVVAAAVALGDVPLMAGLADSKRLSAKRREAAAEAIRTHAVAWAVVAVPPETIDEINILQASLQAMDEAVAKLAITPSEVLVDGMQLPRWRWRSRAIIGGDGLEPCIMAASILAKVHRDGLMQAYDERYPGYGFGVNKGYPTAGHRAALMARGATAIHRRSYAPVRRCLAASEAPSP